MQPARRAELFTATAERLNIAEPLIEKDFWVCRVLKQIFPIESFAGLFLFKGGTSLSKAFGAINRFSEDIDLAVDYAMLGFTGLGDPTQPGLSKTKRATLLAEMLQECQKYISTGFHTALQDRCAAVCRALSSPTICRFIPMHRPAHYFLLFLRGSRAAVVRAKVTAL